MTTIQLPLSIETYIQIIDITNNRILREGTNKIHQENMSVALAMALTGKNDLFIGEMHFGNGGTIISEDGNIIAKPANVTGSSANLYKGTYFRVVFDRDFYNADPANNNTVMAHVNGTTYADTVITAVLEYTDPLANDSLFNIVDATSDSLESTTTVDGEFVFDEIALKTKGAYGLNSGKLLTHFIFHPVEKTADQQIQIVYSLRVRAG